MQVSTEVSTEVSANTVGTFEDGMSLQSCPKVAEAPRAFTPVSPGEGCNRGHDGSAVQAIPKEI